MGFWDFLTKPKNKLNKKEQDQLNKHFEQKNMGAKNVPELNQVIYGNKKQ